MGEKLYPIPELEEALEDFAAIVSKNEFGEILIRENKVILRKAYGEVIYKLLWTFMEADAKAFGELSKEQLRKIGEALIESRNVKRMYKFVELFRGFPNFPEDITEKMAEDIIYNSYWWTCALLRNIPDLPDHIIRMAMIRANKIFYHTGVLKKRAETIRALDSILVYWVVSRFRPIFTVGGSGIPAFYFEHWEVLNETSEGVLLGCESPLVGRNEDRRVRVVLLPDATGQVRGSAVEVGPEVNTVHEARAWMYQQDPEKWKGFDKEV